MKRFLGLSLIMFVLAVMLMLGLVGLINTSRAKIVHVEPDVHIAFLGNSHVANAINDTLIPHSVNWGLSGDRFEFVYAKAKLLKRYNPQIDTIIIGYDDILPFKTVKHAFNSRLSHPFYFDALSFAEWRMLISNMHYECWSNFFLYPTTWEKLGFLSLLNKPNVTIRDYPDMGGFEPRYQDTMIVWDYLRPKSQGNHKCPITTLYLMDQLKQYCRDNDITLIFLCPPQHKDNFIFDSLSYHMEYKAHFQDIPFYDYARWDAPDSCYADLGHLNAKGARRFSLFINSQIRKK